MGNASISNKIRRTPLIDNNYTHIIIYATLPTVKYSKEAYAHIKKESKTTSSGIILKRCRALKAKMSEPGLGRERIAATEGCNHNFVDRLIHSYNYKGIILQYDVVPEVLKLFKFIYTTHKMRLILPLFSPYHLINDRHIGLNDCNDDCTYIFVKVNVYRLSIISRCIQCDSGFNCL